MGNVTSVVRFALVLVAVLITACGGGGGGGSSPAPAPAPTPSPPVSPTPTPPVSPAPEPPVMVILQGSAQKGPMIVGAAITIHSLRPDGSIDREIASTTTSNNLGDYSIEVESGQVVELVAQGQFLNELDGSVAASPVILRAIVEVTDDAVQFANINMLTHLATARTRALMAGGMNYESASARAKADVLAALATAIASPDIESFAGLSLFDEDESHPGTAFLLALSSFLSEEARAIAEQRSTSLGVELQGLLDGLTEDIGDGDVDDPASVIAIYEASFRVDIVAIVDHLMALVTPRS